MKTSQHRRLNKMEKKSRIKGSPERIIILSFGHDSTWATRDGTSKWHRDPGETAEDFESRVLAAMPAPRGAPSVVMFF
jgi:hypothetical protein